MSRTVRHGVTCHLTGYQFGTYTRGPCQLSPAINNTPVCLAHTLEHTRRQAQLCCMLVGWPPKVPVSTPQLNQRGCAGKCGQKGVGCYCDIICTQRVFQTFRFPLFLLLPATLFFFLLSISVSPFISISMSHFVSLFLLTHAHTHTHTQSHSHQIHIRTG